MDFSKKSAFGEVCSVMTAGCPGDEVLTLVIVLWWRKKKVIRGIACEQKFKVGGVG